MVVFSCLIRYRDSFWAPQNQVKQTQVQLRKETHQIHKNNSICLAQQIYRLGQTQMLRIEMVFNLNKVKRKMFS